ncbi:MAG: TonB-dependent receptor [Proteobacteria bacterium]|nr:TonB-dependent receptor [Pseudomonadota bacterium]
MHFISQQHPHLRLRTLAVACQLACLAVGAAHAQQQGDAAKAPDTPQVIITAKKLGMGLMVAEDAPKARSTITAEELEKQRPSGNAYEALQMLPSVNSYNHDATGLFGGGLTLRGFNSDQIGATINGVPVNDSGNFAVFPQEYVDQENTCSEFVTQGSTDVDSPQVGATGGNFGITTCDPEDKRRVRVMQSIGQLNFYKTFARFDTGRWSDDRSKFFISASHAETDKWKGLGKAKRDHVDAGFNYDWDRFNYVHATFLYNEAVNNNILSYSLADLVKNGYYYDYTTVFPGHLTGVNGTAQKETAASPQYYGLSLNPFRNLIGSATVKVRLSEDTDLKFVPYVWYGFGTGGVQQRLQSESAFYNRATGKLDGKVDLNGDGDTLDSVIVANSSLTKTLRPGMQLSLTKAIGNHTLLGGFWYERARHEQTGPMVAVTNDGNPVDDFLQGNQILRPDGTPFQSRDTKTISTAYQFYLQDTVRVLNDQGSINFGVRTPKVKRDFTSYANEGTNSLIAYHMAPTYSDVLPQLGASYNFTKSDLLFASLAKNMKVPPNFAYFPSNGNVTFVNGQAVLASDVKPEVSYNLDAGYRHQDSNFIATVTVFSVDYRDRQATAIDPLSQLSSLTNVGKVKTQGFELEAGNTPVHGWSFYGSFGYTKSEIKDILQLTSTAALNLAGKEMPMTPKLLAGVSAEYQDGPFYTRLKVRKTGKQYATLMNDEEVPGYTTVGLDAGYTFPNTGIFKRPKLSLNLSNLTNAQYRNPSSNSVTNALAYGTSGKPDFVSAKTVFYYMGAPRFASATMSVDF